jgi:hypothetical protein
VSIDCLLNTSNIGGDLVDINVLFHCEIDCKMVMMMMNKIMMMMMMITMMIIIVIVLYKDDDDYDDDNQMYVEYSNL